LSGSITRAGEAGAPRLNLPPCRIDQCWRIHRGRSGREAANAGIIVPITLQGTAGGFSAEFIRQLPHLEQAMAAHGLDPSSFIISKDNAASANMRPLGPFFYDYTVFVGDENFTVTEPNDMRFLEYFMDRIVAPDEPAHKPTGLFSRFAK
jgi:hypothetical protein